MIDKVTISKNIQADHAEQDRWPIGWFYFLLVAALLIGFVLLYIDTLHPNPFLHELGVLFVTVTPSIFVYDFILRREFQRGMGRQIRTAISSSQLEVKVMESIKESLPASFQYVLEKGVVGAYNGIQSNYLHEWIAGASDVELRINNIFIPDVITYKPATFVEAIKNRGCSIKVLLYDAADQNTLNKRASSANRKLGIYLEGIKVSIDFFDQVFQQLNTAELRSKLEVKLHSNFISCPCWGFGDFYLVGIYHYPKSSLLSILYRIHKSGPGVNGETECFKEIEESFKEQWIRAGKEVVFDPEKPRTWDKDNNCYIKSVQKKS